MADVAAQCGIGRTTLYEYFNNKEDIFLHALKREYERFLAEYQTMIQDPHLPCLDKIKGLIAWVVEDYERNTMLVIFTELWLLLKLKNSSLESHIKQRLGEIRYLFTDLVKEAVDIGEIKSVDHEAMSSVLFGLVEAMFLEKAWNKEMKLEAHLEAVNFLLDGLKA